MADEVNAQQDNKKQKPTFPNMVFPSAREVDSEYFGGTAPEKISLDDVKQTKEEQKNEKPKDENQKNKEQKPDEKQGEKQNTEKKQNDNNYQQQNPYKENSIKALKDLGFNSSDDKKFLRKIKNYEVLIELP